MTYRLTDRDEGQGSILRMSLLGQLMVCTVEQTTEDKIRWSFRLLGGFYDWKADLWPGSNKYDIVAEVMRHMETIVQEHPDRALHYATWYTNSYSEPQTLEDYIQHTTCKNIVSSQLLCNVYREILPVSTRRVAIVLEPPTSA